MPIPGLRLPFLGNAVVTYSQFRLRITADNGDGNIEITGFRLFAGSYFPASSMTSNTAPSPLVAFITNELGGFPAYLAFDGNLPARGAIASPFANPIMLSINLGAGNGIAPTSYEIAPAGLLGRAPAAWTLEGSNDGTTWTVINTQSGQTSGWTLNAWRAYTI